MSAPTSFDRVAIDRRLIDRMGETLRAAAFWAAVVIPFVYPLLLYSGLDGGTGLVFVSLLFVNAFALLVGHDYRSGAA